jgi:tRNA A37 threonylcarbamoyladenosine modification protein TsaB
LYITLFVHNVDSLKHAATDRIKRFFFASSEVIKFYLKFYLKFHLGLISSLELFYASMNSLKLSLLCLVSLQAKQTSFYFQLFQKKKKNRPRLKKQQINRSDPFRRAKNKRRSSTTEIRGIRREKTSTLSKRRNR